MKTITKLVILVILSIQCAFAGGSNSWEDVKARIAKSDPELVKAIERSFIVNRSGGGVRLGSQFGERQGGRIASYEFGAEDRKTKAKCILVIEESDDYEYTGRFKFVKKAVENEAHAEQASTTESKPDQVRVTTKFVEIYSGTEDISFDWIVPFEHSAIDE